MQGQQQGRNDLGRGRPARQPQPISTFEGLEKRCLFSASSGDVVLHWNEVLVQSLPATTAPVPMWRNIALVHVAMFDAVNAIDRSYEPYAADVKASRGASAEAAAAQAAHDTLVALYPSRQAVFDAALAEGLADIPRGRARQGVAVGQEVARQILELRANDGASTPAAYTPPNADPGQWQPTAPDFSRAAGANVGLITPFATESNTQFRPAPPPALGSPEYAAAFDAVKEIGSAASTTRTADQTQVAMIWRAPLTHFQVWNRIAQDVADARDTNLADTARLFALMDVAINDGLQTSFASKFHYGLWRPVTAIQRAGEDGNPATEADPAWRPLHPSTPPYPTYAGNAATIGAAAATVLAGVFATDAVPFTVDWGPYGFAGVTRSYDGFADAAEEAARSREYGGIHFRFDSDAGQQIGADVGGYVMDHILSSANDGRQREQGAVVFPGAPTGERPAPGSANASFFDPPDDEVLK